MPAPVAICWFRKGLRLHDNAALLHALEQASAVCPLFVLDPFFFQSGRVGPNRLSFLHECLQDLDASLQRDLGLRLLCAVGDPIAVIPELARRLAASVLAFERDTEPYAIRRDDAVVAAMPASVAVVRPTNHTLLDPDVLLRASGGTAPVSYQSFLKLVEMVGPVPLPRDAPRRSASQLVQTVDASAAADVLMHLEPAWAKATRGVSLRTESADVPFRGGESQALLRLSSWLAERSNEIVRFEKPKTNPTALNPNEETTVLSPYLKFGCLSARLMYKKLRDLLAEHRRQGRVPTRPPVSLEGQLLWREFFYLVAYATPGFDKMSENSLCLQIPWRPYDPNSRRPAALDPRDPSHFVWLWEDARTGFPWIDAAMTQLREQGWMHHLARHAVACFLTRGDLFCHWEAGRDVFDRLLLDADWSLNNGNWLWLSASAFFHQYFRIYSPVAFPRQWDADGVYVRHWLPVLRRLPTKYIYEPWTAPLAVQKECCCIVGVDYPFPIVDHATASRENLLGMKQAFAAKVFGRPSSRGGDGPSTATSGLRAADSELDSSDLHRAGKRRRHEKR